jgi:hypothetical protein
MGANADPSGSLGGPHRHIPSPVPAPPQQQGLAASTVAALRHDPELAVRWSPGWPSELPVFLFTLLLLGRAVVSVNCDWEDVEVRRSRSGWCREVVIGLWE